MSNFLLLEKNSHGKTQLLLYLLFCTHDISVSTLLEWYCSISITSTVAVIIVACFHVPNCPFFDCCVHYLLKFELLANVDAMHGYSSQTCPPFHKENLPPSVLEVCALLRGP